MTDRELEEMLAKALDHAAPDDLEGVLSRCGERRGNVIMLEQTKQTENAKKPAKKFRWWMGLAAACLAVALVAGGAAGGMWYQNNRAVASVISLDVNPSIELKVNQNERVLSCRGVNADAAAILAEMDNGRDLEGSKLDVAVNAIVGALVRHGYLNDISSAILISVEDSNSDRAARLQAQLTATVDRVLQSAASQAGVLSQAFSPDSDVDAQAQQYGVSTGKAAIIARFLDPADPAFPNDPNAAEKLAALSIEELRQLWKDGTNGRIPIGMPAAIEIATRYAEDTLGLTVTFAKADPELEEWYYEVELGTSAGEREVRVEAYTGELLVSSAPGAQAIALRHAGFTEAQVSHLFTYFDSSYRYVCFYADGYWYNYKFDYDKAETVLDYMKTPQRTIYGDIGADAAVDAALKYAGLSRSQVSDLTVEQDWDEDGDGTLLEYEVKFVKGQAGYKYTVEGRIGEVLSWNEIPADEIQGGSQTPAPQTTPAPQSTPAPQNTPAPQTTPKPQTPTVTDIGVDAAKSAALKHAGLSAGQVTWTKAERDYDDGRLEYELEFICNSTEYDYTVLASNGSILKAEQDYVCSLPVAPSAAPAQTPAPQTTPAVTDIGADRAKAAALAHAGLSADQVSWMKCERDYEHGRIEYEIEFRCGGYEYEYTIDGATGAILDHERDWDD